MEFHLFLQYSRLIDLQFAAATGKEREVLLLILEKGLAKILSSH